MKKIAEIAQELILTESRSQAIDFTCGQGFDTLFLAKHFDRVDGFDIQMDAICQSKQRVEGYTNVDLHCVSHEYFDDYVREFDAGIFNLGYLPHGDETITTCADIVIRTLEKALVCLNSKGKIAVVCYPGFNEGKAESAEVEEWLSLLPSKHYDVVHISLVNRKNAPYICLIEKH